MLGLVAMATSVDALYASMKALVCIVGNNQVALKEMERTGGFQVDLTTHLYIIRTLYVYIYPTSSMLCVPNLIYMYTWFVVLVIIELCTHRKLGVKI